MGNDEKDEYEIDEGSLFIPEARYSFKKNFELQTFGY